MSINNVEDIIKVVNEIAALNNLEENLSHEFHGVESDDIPFFEKDRFIANDVDNPELVDDIDELELAASALLLDFDFQVNKLAQNKLAKQGMKIVKLDDTFWIIKTETFKFLFS